jgi:hypothetical protein
MSPVSLIPSLQSDALVRDLKRQLADETAAIAQGAQREAQAILAQSRSAARSQVHEAIEELRAEGERRLTRAKAQLETAARARAQRQAAQAVRDTLPLLREALAQRWRQPASRQQWTAAVARLCADRLPPRAWRVEHPCDWTASEQKQFAAAIGDGAQVSFQAGNISSGLRVSADQAVLDATPQGLLADSTMIAALLLDEIGAPP